MTIRTELNPYLETLGLLYLSAHPEKASRSFWCLKPTNWGSTGMRCIGNSALFISGTSPPFKKQWNREEISAMDGFDFFLRHRRLDSLPPLRMRRASHWFAPNGSPLQEEEIILPFVNQILTDRTVTKVPSLSELLSLLEQSGLSTALCWKMTLCCFNLPCPGSVNSSPLSKRACPPINTHRKPLPFHWESCLPRFPIRNIPPPPWKTRRYLRLSWFSLPWKPS